MTFRASDIDKLLSYINHADIVVGTRIVETLQEKNTQLSTFMHYGNLFVAKLLELKYLASVTLSDVGTTYKICRISAIKKMVSKLDNNVNLTFNPYFLEKAIKNNLQIVECPITFFPRIGFSKGGNINNRVAMKLGLQMILEYSLAGRISLKNKYHETRIAYDLKEKLHGKHLLNLTLQNLAIEILMF